MLSSPTPDHFQEAVAVLKGAMQAEQQFKRGATDQGAEAAAMYDQGLALLDLAIRSDRHVAIREQLQQKSADVQKKVRALKRRVEPADVEEARARLAGELTGQGLELLERTPLPAAPRPAVGLTPGPSGGAQDTYATPSDHPVEQSLGTPRTVQRSVALQQATAARHELFDSTASPQTLETGGTTGADVRAQAERRVFAADEARHRAEAALRQAEARERAAHARAEAAERELVTAREQHATEIQQRLASATSQFQARLADEVTAARERGREEGITLSPRDRVRVLVLSISAVHSAGSCVRFAARPAALRFLCAAFFELLRGWCVPQDMAARPLALRSSGTTAGVTTLEGRGIYGVGLGEWKADLLRRKLAAAQSYVAQLEQQLESAAANGSSS